MPSHRFPCPNARLVLLLVLLCCATPAAGQTPTYTLALRGVSLDEALEYFAGATGLAVAYDPGLVRGHRTFCALDSRPAEEVLTCILRESGLDFYRLSSGTFVITHRAEVAPQHGYLSGLVTDRETGAPLAGAHVYLASAGLGSVTNDAGYFIFPPLLPGPYTLSITHLGYHPWQDTLQVAPDTRIRAEADLQAEPIVITPVVVDGLQTHRASELLGRPGVEGRALTAGPGGSLRGSLQGLRALTGVRVNDLTADVHLQGGEAGDHQMRLDGVPVFLPRSVVGLVGPFSAFSVERITVHKAGFGVAEGSQTAGILAAEHALGRQTGLDVQVDPLSFNARLQFVPGAGGPRPLSVMAAARVGLWDLLPPTRLQATLNDWSALDPFLLLAPLDPVTGPVPGTMPERWGLHATPDPALHFSDVHLAARLPMGPLRSVYASFFDGRSHLGGGLLPARHSLGQAEYTAPLTVADDYGWRNTLGQVRYQAVLGGRTLVGVQAYGSLYQFDHAYEMLDSLELSYGRPELYLSDLATTPVAEGNRVRTFALRGTVDHAQGRHQLHAGLEAALTDSRFELLSVRFPDESDFDDGPSDLQPAYREGRLPHQAVLHTSTGPRLAGFAEDTWRVGARTTLEAGLRLSYLADRQTVYAEPRAALRFDQPDGPLGPWSIRTAAGLYRQYVNQLDASKLNAGALLPTVRIWLPVDGTVRPPLAYHLAQELLWTPTPRWTFRAEGYLKHQPHGLALRYAPAGTRAATGVRTEQRQLLANTDGVAYGTAVALAWKTRPLHLQARYEYSYAARRSPRLFDGRTETAPWNEPHRLEVGADWTPGAGLTFSARWQGVWGRAWGFRRAYYDYFGHSPETRYHGPYDFGRPSDHVLPALYQLDVSLAYTRSLGGASLQLRGEVLNVLDRRNVADWRLVEEGRAVYTVPRYYYPVMPSLALRVGF